MILMDNLHAWEHSVQYGNVYVPFHVLFIFYLSILILDKSTLNSEKSTLNDTYTLPYCLIYFLLVDFNLGKIDVNLGKTTLN